MWNDGFSDALDEDSSPVQSYLLRVHLPNRPGVLGAVASRIGAVGGHVETIEIVERSNENAIDELTIGLPKDRHALAMKEICAVDGVRVEVFKPCPANGPDRHLTMLAVTTEMLQEPAYEGIVDKLAAAVRNQLHADWAAAVECPDGGVVACSGEAEPLAPWLARTAPALAANPYGRNSKEAGSADGCAWAASANGGIVVMAARQAYEFRKTEHQLVAALVDFAGLCLDGTAIDLRTTESP